MGRRVRAGLVSGNRATALLGAMGVAALAYLAPPSPAVANPIIYTLLPPVIAGPVTITGGFTFDPSNKEVGAIDFDVVGGP
jgi:hypothetical protein